MGNCRYCGGNCENEQQISRFLCDGFAGDIDGLYKEQDEWSSSDSMESTHKTKEIDDD